MMNWRGSFGQGGYPAFSWGSFLRGERMKTVGFNTQAGWAGYQRPKKIVLGELPKIVTGKIRKNELRDLVGIKD